MLVPRGFAIVLDTDFRRREDSRTGSVTPTPLAILQVEQILISPTLRGGRGALHLQFPRLLIEVDKELPGFPEGFHRQDVEAKLPTLSHRNYRLRSRSAQAKNRKRTLFDPCHYSILSS